MKLNLSYKYLNLIIFLLLVAVVLALFGVISNMSVNNSGNGAFAYILLFSILFLDVVWYFASLKKPGNSEVVASSVRLDQEILKDPRNLINNEKEEIWENKREIDITRIIPKNCKSVEEFFEITLRNLAQEFNIVQGIVYLKHRDTDFYESIAQYAYFSESKPQEFKSGETLPGQAVKNRTIVVLSDVPENYLTIASGLGKSDTKYLVFVPLIHKEEVIGLIEYATFAPVKEEVIKLLGSFAEKVAETIVKLIKK